MMASQRRRRGGPARTLGRFCAVALLLAASGESVPAQAAPSLTVSADGPLRTITEAIRVARPGARIVVSAGTYREPTILVDKPVGSDATLAVTREPNPGNSSPQGPVVVQTYRA